MRKLIAGMDLHSNNVVIGLMDMDGKRVAHQKVECKLSQVLKSPGAVKRGQTITFTHGKAKVKSYSLTPLILSVNRAPRFHDLGKGARLLPENF